MPPRWQSRKAPSRNPCHLSLRRRNCVLSGPKHRHPELFHADIGHRMVLAELGRTGHAGMAGMQFESNGRYGGESIRPPRHLTTHPGCLNDLYPTGDVLLHKIGERLLTAARLVWDFVNEVEQPLARNIGIKRLIEGVGEFVENRFRGPLRSKQRNPGRYFELWQAR